MANLYLIPTTLGDTPVDHVIPAQVQEIVKNIKTFIVENIRTTRRYIKKIDKSIDIDSITFYELNKHTKLQDINHYLDDIKKGDIGIISEAGCPGIADPGADIVKIAHEKNINVIPLVGPSSILLALMASGFNGQIFTFNGYLPVKQNDRIDKIKQLEKIANKERHTQLFIEAPYRNIPMVEDILKACNDNTMLCLACDITTEDQYIKTKSIKEWRKIKPNIHKRPAIFAIFCN